MEAHSTEIVGPRPFSIHALTTDGGHIWHHQIVTIDSAADHNLIDIEILEPEWRAHIKD